MEASSPKKRLSREESRDMTRRALLTAAAELFATQGFHGTSIDAVAERAGYTKGAVYANFASKSDLYLALLDERLGQENDEWERLLASGAPLGERAEAWGKCFAQQISQDRSWSLLTLEFSLHAMRDERVREALRERVGAAKRRYEECLAARYELLGQKPPLHAATMAAVMLGLDNGLSLLYLLSEDEAYADAWAKGAAALIDR